MKSKIKLGGALVLAAVLLVAFTAIVVAGQTRSGDIKIILNGEEVIFDVPPQVIDGRVMVPVCKIAEKFGANVEWDDEMSAVIITTGENESETTTENISECGRFVLTVSVEETTIMQGESFTIYIELKNNSGEDIVIYYSILFLPRIPGWIPFGGVAALELPEPRPRLFEAGEVIQRGWRIGDLAVLGTHEMRVNTGFYLNFRQDNMQEVRLSSSIIEISVQ